MSNFLKGIKNKETIATTNGFITRILYIIPGVPKNVFRVCEGTYKPDWIITHMPSGCHLPLKTNSFETISKLCRKFWRNLSKEDRNNYKKLTLMYALRAGIEKLGIKEPP